jgi:pimeloyl-ACP methyl ester carboxylesterase
VGWGLTDEPLVLARDRSMFVGGQYAQSVDGLVIDGAMYVHERVPAQQTHPYPIVMIHGVNGTGAYFEGTPDGREGWAQLFVRAGFAVYVVDQPARGRSPYFPDLHGPMPASSVFGAQALAELYTAPAVYDTYPQAKLHTQWPSDHANAGRPGDPVFDRSLAGQVKSLPTATGTPERLIKAAGGALLDRIGPAILLTHSQGGAFGWQIADARPGAVKAIVTIEPALTPAHPQGGSATPAYGITMNPITYDPPVTDPSAIVHRVIPADSADVSECWVQAEPVRRLPTLAGIPIAIIIGEASPLAQRSHCISHYLTQAGVANDLIRLENVGIHGNNHKMMIEKNSAEIATFIQTWLAGHDL